MIPILGIFKSVPIYSFGLMISLGFLAAYLRVRKDFQRASVMVKLDWWFLVVVFVALICGQVGTDDPFLFSAGFNVWLAVIGAFLAIVAGATYFGISLQQSIKLFAPSVLLLLTIWHLGAHLAGDGSYGTLTESNFGMSFMTGTVPTAPGLKAYPLALIYSLTFALVLAGLVKRYDN